MHENEEYIYQILKSGAGGYILKNATKDELASAIQGSGGWEKNSSVRKFQKSSVNSYLNKAKQRDTACARR